MKLFMGLVVVALGISACSGANENSCLDGTCSDPARPFCDADGFFSGTQGLCIHVDCTPEAFERCLGNEAQVCTADGTGYRSVQCPNGCGSAGCNGNPTCTTDAQCSNPSPVCDVSTHTCRVCTNNDECDSTVCEEGACVPESSLVFSSPTGINSGACTRTSPCTLARAVTIAASGAGGKLRMLPGTYTDALLVDNAQATLTVYGEQATIAGNGHLEVRNGTVEVNGVTVQSTLAGIEGIHCGAPGTPVPPFPRLTLHDVKSIGSLAINQCTTKVERYTQVGGSIRVDDDGVLDMDRAFIDNSAATSTPADFFASGARLRVTVTNSLFVNVWLQFNTMDLATTNQVKLAYSTFVMAVTGSGVGPFVCPSTSSYAQVGQIENSIVVAPAGIDAVTGTKCTTTNNVLFPQSSSRPGNIVADPQFVNPSTKDFRPKSTSPARGAAMGGTLMTDHDYVGAVRPQGTGPDMGAFEVP